MSLVSPNNRKLPELLTSKANEVIVPAREVLTLPITVERSGSTLNYKFETKENDINFAIEFRDEKNVITEILPMRRIESHQRSESGTFMISTPGLVFIKWDNSYSWMTNKVLSYTITLSIPAPTRSDLNETAGLKLRELENHRNALEKAKRNVVDLEEECENNETTLKFKNEEYERLKVEISTIETNCHNLKQAIERTRYEINYETTSLHNTYVFGVFEVCGTQIVEYLTSCDLLNVGMSSRVFTPFTRDRDLWKRLLQKEAKSSLQKSLRSRWLTHLYAELYPESDIAKRVGDILAHTPSNSQPQSVQPILAHPTTSNQKPPQIEQKDLEQKEFVPLAPSVDGEEGWYKNKDNALYYFIFNSKHERKCITSPLTPLSLQDLIEKANKSEVLIACPGTVQGESGSYINKKSKVTQWEIKKDGQWIKVNWI